MGTATENMLRQMRGDLINEQRKIKQDKENLEKLKNDVKKYFRNYILSSLYVEDPVSEEDVKRNGLIKSLGVNLYTEDNVAIVIDDQSIKYTEIKQWLTEICSQLDLTLCNNRDFGKYKKENSFLLLNSSISHMSIQAMSALKQEAKGVRFGLLFIENAETIKWTKENRDSLSEIIDFMQGTINGGGQKVLSIISPEHKNLSFLEDYEFHLESFKTEKVESFECVESVKSKSELTFFQKLIRLIRPNAFVNNEVLSNSSANRIVDNSVVMPKEHDMDKAIMTINMVIKRNKNYLSSGLIDTFLTLKQHAVYLRENGSLEKMVEMKKVLIDDIPLMVSELKKASNKEQAEHLVLDTLKNTVDYFVQDDNSLKNLRTMNKISQSRLTQSK